MWISLWIKFVNNFKLILSPKFKRDLLVYEQGKQIKMYGILKGYA